VARGSIIDNVELIVDNALKVDKQLSTVNYQLPIKVKNFKDIAAMQYTLHFDNTKFEFVNLEGFKNLQGFEYNATQANTTGNISMLWTDKNAEAKTLEDGTVVFTLVLKPVYSPSSIDHSPLTITNDITDIAAWDKDFKEHNIILSQKLKVETQNLNEIWSVSPNPNSGDIKVNMICKTNKTIHFELSDAQGRTLLQQNFEAVKGNNTINMNLKKNTHLSNGIYFLKAIGLEGEDVKKLIIE
jgi:hypothetical protein